MPLAGPPRASSSAWPAALPPIKRAELLRLLTESGHRRTGRSPPRRRCTSSGQPPGPRCPAEPVATDRLVRRQPGRSRPARPRGRSRRGRAGHGGSAGPRRPRPMAGRPADRDPAHRPAVRCCSRRRCTPRCGSTRPPRPTSPPCARAVRSCSTPASGRLTGADSGSRPAARPSRDLHRGPVRLLLHPDRDLAGRRVVVSAGGTREPLDPVRFLGNRSSGRQGYALASVAAARGAHVTVGAANVALPDPAGTHRPAGVHRGRAAQARC